jgi:hypothetical protein
MSLLSMTRGDSRAFAIELTDGDGLPLDLTGLALVFSAKRRISDSDDRALITKTEVDGIVVDDDPTTGLAILTIAAPDTEGLSDRVLYWDLQVDDGAGDVKTPLSGLLSLDADVTQASTAGS